MLTRSVHLFAVILLASSGLAHAEPLKFSATGCGPYKPEEEPLLEKYVKLVSEDNQSEFFVHLAPGPSCAEISDRIAEAIAL